MSVLMLASKAAQDRFGAVPCRTNASELWFSDTQTDIDQAQRMCRTCPLMTACLAGALERKEPWGVWGGELLERGVIIAQKKPKGRPRKDAAEVAQQAADRLAERLTGVA